MKNHTFYLFTRTPLHVGAGSSVGAVDLPVQRERHTGYPIIPGSSIKGVMRDFHETEHGVGSEETLRLFGKADESGESRGGIATFGEARLLLFPVRSAQGGFALATCPLALARYRRDAGLDHEVPEEPAEMTCRAGSEIVRKERTVLEEYAFKHNGAFPEEWETHLMAALDDAVLKGAKGHFVLLANGDFAHFVQTTCPVSQHVAISDEKGTAIPGALFNEETVPPESLFYANVTEQTFNAGETEGGKDRKALDAFTGTLAGETLLQFGGNNSAGLGFATVLLKNHQATA